MLTKLSYIAGNGNGYGDGYGYSNGYGYGDGYGNGYGNGDGYGDGYGTPNIVNRRKMAKIKQEKDMSEIVINGEIYMKKDEVKDKDINRCVVVIDRGWVYAGDVKRENGRILLTRAVWVFKWVGVGFNGVIENPKSPDVTLRKMDHDISIPEHSELFSVKVDDDWGL